MKKFFSLLIVAILAIGLFSACSKPAEPKSTSDTGNTANSEAPKDDNKQEADKKEVDHKWNVVATSTMLRDLAEVIGGDKVEVTGIIGIGVDPHLYKPTAGDVKKIKDSEMLVYNGLHFEGQMIDILEAQEKEGKVVACAADGMDKSDVLPFEEGSAGDPHIWNSTLNWEGAAKQVCLAYQKLDPANADYYQKNCDEYVVKLQDLKKYIEKEVAQIPQESRVIITAHDAFNYLAKDYGFEMKGIQGISTESEASVGDISEIVDFIIERNIKGLFVESSVPKKNVEALQEAVRAKGGNIEIAGELYSDSLGDEGTEEGTYLGMMKYNIDTIVKALK